MLGGSLKTGGTNAVEAAATTEATMNTTKLVKKEEERQKQIEDEASGPGITKYLAEELKKSIDSNNAQFHGAVLEKVKKVVQSKEMVNQMKERVPKPDKTDNPKNSDLETHVEALLKNIDKDYEKIDLVSANPSKQLRDIKRTMVLHLLRDGRCKEALAQYVIENGYPEKQLAFSDNEYLKTAHLRKYIIRGGATRRAPVFIRGKRWTLKNK